MNSNHYENLKSFIDSQTIIRYNTSEYLYLFVDNETNKLAQIFYLNKTALVVATSDFDAFDFLTATSQLDKFKIGKIRKRDIESIILKYGSVAICKGKDAVMFLNLSENKH